MRLQYWECTKNQKLWTRPTVHCNKHLQVKLFQQKDILWVQHSSQGHCAKWICDGGIGVKTEEWSGFVVVTVAVAMWNLVAVVFIIFFYFIRGDYNGGGQTRKDWEMSGMSMYDVKFWRLDKITLKVILKSFYPIIITFNLAKTVSSFRFEDHLNINLMVKYVYHFAPKSTWIETS